VGSPVLIKQFVFLFQLFASLLRESHETMKRTGIGIGVDFYSSVFGGPGPSTGARSGGTGEERKPGGEETPESGAAEVVKW
jgi:hypothetical protein